MTDPADDPADRPADPQAPEPPPSPGASGPRDLPIVWLLGKTGAGKSSLIRRLTGLDEIEIGNGYAPCTRTSRRFDFPADVPLVRFLDTRGLGEAGYDPTEDLAACKGHSHALLILCRLDDPVQGEVAEAAAKAFRGEDAPVLLVHTGADLLDDPGERDRARHATAERFRKAFGRALPEVEIALGGDAASLGGLVDHLLEVLPAAALVLDRRSAATEEQAAFDEVKNRVLFYAGVAGASDVLPVVGAVSVPAAQMAMLRELCGHHHAEWSWSLASAFFGSLGSGIAARFAASFGLRQLTKLIPVYGQTVGAAAAGGVSFAATYALGRAASYWLYHRRRGEEPDPEALKAAFSGALSRASRG